MEHNISYQPSKFQFSRLSGSDFNGGGGGGGGRKLPEAKRPVLLGLRKENPAED